MRSEDLAGLIGGLGAIVVAAFIVKASLEYVWRSRSLKMRKEMQSRLMDKFGSAPEFAQFLETASGRQFLETVSAGPTNAHEKILNSVRTGIIMAVLGLALVAVNGIAPSESRAAFQICGLIGMLVGIGYIISSFVSYRLSKAWGLLTPPTDRP
ncbi:MAG: hypothetical protein PHX83_15830 [Acidobacteriia bacterium]|nr:hypothetical protein [Terriglobia bacterium]